MAKVKLGGMAYSDGVYFHSDNFWAFASEDGSLDFGEKNKSVLGKTLDTILEIVDLRIIIFIEIAVFILNKLKEMQILKPPYSVLFVWSITGIIFLRILSPLSGKRKYHGAEHKVANAYEVDEDIGDIEKVKNFSRFHHRCGSVIGAIFLPAILWIDYIGEVNPVLAGRLFYYLIFVFVGLFFLYYRILEKKFPNSVVTKFFIFGGTMLQKISTTEPTEEQIEIAIRAAKKVIELETKKV